MLALRELLVARGLPPEQRSPKAYWGRGRANAGQRRALARHPRLAGRPWPAGPRAQAPGRPGRPRRARAARSGQRLRHTTGSTAAGRRGTCRPDGRWRTSSGTQPRRSLT